MPELASILGWFVEPPDARSPKGARLAKDWLEETWSEVRREIGPDRFDPILGEIRAGRMGRRDNTAWAQTNDKQSFHGVNMTLDLSEEGLALNVIGWFDQQLEAMTNWLRLPAANRFLSTIPHWFVVVFIRHANIGADNRAVFQGAGGTEVKRLSLADTSPSSIRIELTGMRPKLDPRQERLSLHIRRLWTPAEIQSLDDIPTAIVPEVERWLEPIQAMRLA